MINTIIHWDCLEIMKNIPDGSIDAIITDPPYGTTKCSWDTVIPFEEMWKELKRIIKPNWAILLFGSEPFSSLLRTSNLKMYKYDWKWRKERWVWFQIAKYRPMMETEDIMIFSKNTPNYYPIMIPLDKPKIEKFASSKSWVSPLANINHGERYVTWRYPKNIIEISRDNRNKLHPTQKPVALIEYLIKTYTNEWEIVLDFTAWSFTTAVASDNTNRKWICIEQDEWYCKIWAKRINENRIKLWIELLDFTSILKSNI